VKNQQDAYFPHSVSSLIGDLICHELHLHQDQGPSTEFVIRMPRRDVLAIGVDNITLEKLGMDESKQRVAKV
jgi:hypothetical protein